MTGLAVIIVLKFVPNIIEEKRCHKIHIPSSLGPIKKADRSFHYSLTRIYRFSQKFAASNFTNI